MGTYGVGLDGRCIIRKGPEHQHRGRIMPSGPTVVARRTTLLRKVGPLLRANHEARYMCEILVFEYYELYGAVGFSMDLSLELGVYKLGDDAEDRNPAIIVLQNAGVRDG